jgi:hypothetical protein
VQPLIEFGSDPLRHSGAEAGAEVMDGLADAFGVVSAPDVVGGQGKRAGLIDVTTGGRRTRMLNGDDGGLLGAPR